MSDHWKQQACYNVIIKNNKLVIITERKIIYSIWLTEDVDNNVKHEIDYIIKHNEVLAEFTRKSRLVDYCWKYRVLLNLPTTDQPITDQQLTNPLTQ